MILKDLWNLFENELFQKKTEANLFNQYNDMDKRVDLLDAPKIRRENLKRYLENFVDTPSVFIVGEAPGPWGCRFSGVPFTSERQLCNEDFQKDFHFSGQQSSKDNPSGIDIKRKTPYTGASATIFWNTMKPLKPLHSKCFVWNCVPFHPHEPNYNLSVRNPTPKEQAEYSKMLSEMKRILGIENIISVGRKAEESLKQIGIKSVYVRHPARGRVKEFRDGINDFFNTISLD